MPIWSQTFREDANERLVNAWCALLALVYDPAETGFKVSGTFVSPVDERSPSKRKPLFERLSSVTMVLYALYVLFVAAVLALLAATVSYNRFVGGSGRFMYTGAALRLVDLLLSASVPLRYMASPPDAPDRRELLEKDDSGVFRSRKTSWMRRDGGSVVKLPLQVAIIPLFDWL